MAKHYSKYEQKRARRKKGGPINLTGLWPFNNQDWLNKYNLAYVDGKPQKAPLFRMRRFDELS